jgi:hypothetical protein
VHYFDVIFGGSTVIVNAIAAQAVPADEMNWSCPCGKPLSK